MSDRRKSSGSEETLLRPLYIAQSFQELAAKQCVVDYQPSKGGPAAGAGAGAGAAYGKEEEKCIAAVQKMYAEATKVLSYDHERAYVLCMHSVELVMKLRAGKRLKQQDATRLGKIAENALNAAETLKATLKLRYEQLAQSRRSKEQTHQQQQQQQQQQMGDGDDKDEEAISSKSLTSSSSTPAPTPNPALPDANSHDWTRLLEPTTLSPLAPVLSLSSSPLAPAPRLPEEVSRCISPAQLFQATFAKASLSEAACVPSLSDSAVAVLDTRPAFEYDALAMSWGLCANIGPEYLAPNIPVTEIMKALPAASLARRILESRGTVSRIVIVTKLGDPQIDLENELSPARMLADAIEKWDFSGTAPKAPVCLLEGGMDTWSALYPALCKSAAAAKENSLSSGGAPDRKWSVGSNDSAASSASTSIMDLPLQRLSMSASASVTYPSIQSKAQLQLMDASAAAGESASSSGAAGEPVVYPQVPVSTLLIKLERQAELARRAAEAAAKAQAEAAERAAKAEEEAKEAARLEAEESARQLVEANRRARLAERALREQQERAEQEAAEERERPKPVDRSLKPPLTKTREDSGDGVRLENDENKSSSSNSNSNSNYAMLDFSPTSSTPASLPVNRSLKPRLGAAERPADGVQSSAPAQTNAPAGTREQRQQLPDAHPPKPAPRTSSMNLENFQAVGVPRKGTTMLSRRSSFDGSLPTPSPLPSPSPVAAGSSPRREMASTLAPRPGGSPSAAPVLISAYGGIGDGLTGLRNLGNTCFMNSILQCLSCTMPLSVYFISNSFRGHVNVANRLGRKGALAESFAELLRNMWLRRYRCFAPMDFLNAVCYFAPQFDGGSQHDSQELLAFLLDALHEDLNSKGSRNAPRVMSSAEPGDDEDTDGIPMAVLAEASWKKYTMRNQSIIVDMFQGQFKSAIQCLRCGHSSVTFNPFMYLSLPIPLGQSSPSLDDCIRLFTKSEKIDGENQWFCAKCKAHRSAVKTLEIWSLPPILLIHLKRFYFDGPWRAKLEDFVDFPIQDLNMTKYAKDGKQYAPYSLYAISNHNGTMEGGHYTALCRNPIHRKWYQCDDSVVREASSSLKSRSAYVLFYTNMEFERYAKRKFFEPSL